MKLCYRYDWSRGLWVPKSWDRSFLGRLWMRRLGITR
jgi:hypothetical protein